MEKKFILSIFVVIFAVGVGYYIYSDFVRHRVANITELTSDTSENQQPEQLEQLQQLEHPNLDRPIKTPAGLDEDVRKIATEKIAKLSDDLKKDPGVLAGWLDLGIYRKMLGDYEGAEESWKYACVISPGNSASFNNLGDLYAYYLKDSVKAEENFLKAMENGSDQVYIYRNIYDFYRFVMKDDAKAKRILEQGIKANPDTSQDLQSLLKSY